MATTDIDQLCRDAICQILDADPGVQAITRRSSENCVPWRTGSKLERLPILLLAFVAMNPIGGTGDTRRARYQITAVAKGGTGGRVVNDLMERVELALTQPALAANGLDAFVERTDRSPGYQDDTPGEYHRANIDLTLIVRKPLP